MEMELKIAKLELENKVLEQKLKHQELMVEQKALKEKVAKIEQKREKNVTDAKCLTVNNMGNERASFQNMSTFEEISVLVSRIAELNRAKTIESSIGSSCDLFGQDGNGSDDDDFHMDDENGQKEEERKTPTNEISSGQFKEISERIVALEQQSKDNVDQFSKILEKISELEKQQKQQHQNTNKATSDKLSKMQNDQKTLFEKVSELEKEQKRKKEHLNFQQNFWDANVCHKNLQIIGDNNLTVYHKGTVSVFWRSVFAKHSILLNRKPSNFSYYEISIKNKKDLIIFGFAVKQQTKLKGLIRHEIGTYAYESDGEIWINGEGKGTNAKYSYGVGDTVGIGVHFITRQLFFTKNGQHLDSSADFFVAPSFADSFHPFVSLLYFDDKIEANFGPNFKFDLATL
ncbi:hypothetical protein niasHT_002386 [Heterodera trifolii]|uniref:B30.2/SPRY domain-containing protein n=1 Tax=Heterodera trifolii TaxID=157864 RepID=A0ABD2LM43_9BILA